MPRGEGTNPVESRAAAEIGRLPYPGWVMVKARRRIDTTPKWRVMSSKRVLAHKATLGVYIQYEPFSQTWTIEGKEDGPYSTLLEAVTVVELRLGEKP